ncbi:hypothetical protein RRG08_022582 [Elysia crispata]|uniref:Rab-GAP TBC domain-containing protein n=1 Tax=Elysia crispata TaxID=231223 RepID=A0AAE0Z2P8_9GAST|nr:hypothetical protein RRG08_022582 [Elysia crispata]
MAESEGSMKPEVLPVIDKGFDKIYNDSESPESGLITHTSQFESEASPSIYVEKSCFLPQNTISCPSDMDDLGRKDLTPLDQRVETTIERDKSLDQQVVSSNHKRHPETSKNPVSLESLSSEVLSDNVRNSERNDQSDIQVSERSETSVNSDICDGAKIDEHEKQICPACEDICLEDFEMAELSDSHDSTTGDAQVVSEESGQSKEISRGHGGDSNEDNDDSFRQRSPSPAPCVLRHRLDPEPPRSGDTDSATRLEETKPKTSKEIRKLAEIQKALDADPVDVESLRRLAISPGGLINKHMRQRVWPLLMNVNTNNIPPKPEQEEMEAMTKTYNQVVMDVNRSSSRFPPGIDDQVRMSMKDKLVDLIMRVMIHHNGQLKYYQGFHDVCVTFLLCMDEDMSFAMVNKLAIGYMREYLDETMERTSLLLSYIYPLVHRCNPELCEHMQRNDLGTIFALSWVITWFSHVLGDIRRILRVFDFFLASHRMMPVYLSAAFVLHRESDIFDAGDEMGYIHKCLSVIPPDLPLESLLERAGDLFLQYPPTEISQDPMLIRLNNQVFEHFNHIERRNARRLAQQQEASHLRSRVFVRITLWTVTAVVGVAVAVLYHTYSSEQWTAIGPWNSS